MRDEIGAHAGDRALGPLRGRRHQKSAGDLAGMQMLGCMGDGAARRPNAPPARPAASPPAPPRRCAPPRDAARACTSPPARRRRAVESLDAQRLCQWSGPEPDQPGMMRMSVSEDFMVDQRTVRPSARSGDLISLRSSVARRRCHAFAESQIAGVVARQAMAQRKPDAHQLAICLHDGSTVFDGMTARPRCLASFSSFRRSFIIRNCAMLDRPEIIRLDGLASPSSGARAHPIAPTRISLVAQRDARRRRASTTSRTAIIDGLRRELK